MKKYLMLGFATLALAVGCTEFRSEDAVAVDTTDAVPTISLTETTSVGDDGDAVYSIQATITGASSTTYYSYLVAEGAAAELDATALLKVTYSDMASATVNYSTTPTTTLSLAASPNTTYTLYAVGANAQGQVGSITTQTVTTSNLDTPYPTAFEYDEAAGVMYVDFSESVTLGSSAAVSAYVYAQTTEIDTIEISASDLSVDGSTLVITLPELYPASIVYLNWAEGVVKNSASTPSPAYTGSSIAYQVTPVNFDIFVGSKADDGSYETDEEGAYVEQDGSTIYFSDNTDIVALFTDGTQIAGYGDADATCIVYDGTKTTSYALTAGSDYGLDISYTTVAAFFPEALNYGATAEFTFAEGAFVDMYGNLSNAVSTGDIYYRSRALSSDDIVGTYALSGVSYWDGYLEEGAVVTISSTTVKSVETLTMTGLCYGSGAAVTITFNEHSGQISIADWQEISSYDYYGEEYPIYFANADDYDDVTFDYIDADTFTSSEKWWGYYIDELGWYEVYETATLSRIEVEATPSTSSVSSSANALAPRENFVETRFFAR